jgi:hypothetical protein
VGGNNLNVLIRRSKEDYYEQHYSPINKAELYEMIGCLIENIQSGYAYSEMIVDGNGKVIFSICQEDIK